MAKSKIEDIGGQDHWEKGYDPTPRPGNPNGQWMRNWDPKYGKDRPQPHNKINELDH